MHPSPKLARTIADKIFDKIVRDEATGVVDLIAIVEETLKETPPAWYYGKQQAPEGHVIKVIEAPLRQFSEYARYLLEAVIVFDESDVWKRERALTLKALQFGFLGIIEEIRQKQEENHPTYNPWDAGATVHRLRERRTEWVKKIFDEYREQRRAFLNKPDGPRSRGLSQSR